MPETRPYFCFQTITCKCQGILTKLGTCIDIKEIWFGIANGQISSMFDRVICPRHVNGVVLQFNALIIFVMFTQEGIVNAAHFMFHFTDILLFLSVRGNQDTNQ